MKRLSILDDGLVEQLSLSRSFPNLVNLKIVYCPEVTYKSILHLLKSKYMLRLDPATFLKHYTKK